VVNKYKSLSREKRRLISKGNGRCHYCKREVSVDRKDFHSPHYATRDHYIPLSKGGKNAMSNIVLCCRECNQKKGNMMPGEFWRRRHMAEVDYEAAFKKDCLGDAARAFCQECLGWGEAAAYAGDSHIVNGSWSQGNLNFTSWKPAMSAVHVWCDKNDAVLETRYSNGTNGARVKTRMELPEDVMAEWQESENLLHAIFMACVEAAREKSAVSSTTAVADRPGDRSSARL
jgi:hypothetical protein